MGCCATNMEHCIKNSLHLAGVPSNFSGNARRGLAVILLWDMRFCTWLGGEIGGAGSDASVFSHVSCCWCVASKFAWANTSDMHDNCWSHCWWSILWQWLRSTRIEIHVRFIYLFMRSVSKNRIQTGMGLYSQVNNNNVSRDVSVVITGSRGRQQLVTVILNTKHRVKGRRQEPREQ